MKNLLTIIALFITSVAFAQTQDTTKQEPRYVIQFSQKDTVNKVEYTIVVAETKHNEYVFFYSDGWSIQKAEVNKMLAVYNPIITGVKLINANTWQFDVAENMADPDGIISNVVTILTFPGIQKMNATLNKK